MTRTAEISAGELFQATVGFKLRADG